MKKMYVVYLNKSYDVWARDAHTWADKKNLPVEDGNIISEVIFWHYIDKGLLDGIPVYFCKDIQDDRKAWSS